MTVHPGADEQCGDRCPYVIDCDADPSVPRGLSIEYHKKHGSMLWTPRRFGLYLSERQKNGVLTGKELEYELEDQPVANACVGDFFVKNPDLIPEKWIGLYLFFWGTIYRDIHRDLYVRCLYMICDEWRWTFFRLVSDRHITDPAVILTS